MPLMIWLKEPPIRIIVEGEWNERKEEEMAKMLEGDPAMPKLIVSKSMKSGQPIMYAAANVGAVMYVSEQEIAEMKDRVEKSGGKGPDLMIPGGRH